MRFLRVARIFEWGVVCPGWSSLHRNSNILRLYGKGFTVLTGSDLWDLYSKEFTIYPSTRQIIVADISLVQTSCGFGVPLFDYTGERDIHFEWAEKKGVDGLAQYMQDKNLISLDSLPIDLGLKYS